MKSHTILAGNNPEQMKNFKWENVIKNAKIYMPVLLKLLRQCLQTATKRKNETSVTGMIICMLVKHRIPQLCLLQKVVSLLLYSGHCSKKVIKYLSVIAISDRF